jgi:hypothetical protein
MRTAQAFRRVPVPSQLEPGAKTKTIYAANKGLGGRHSIGAPAPGYAQVIENGYSTPQGITPRSGKVRHATTGTKALNSFIAFKGSATSRLFACGDGKIWDVKTPISPIIVLTPLMTGKTGNNWSYEHVTNAGGRFVLAVNGSDLHMTYSEATGLWQINTPAITGISSTTLSQVFSHAQRPWFIQKNSLSAWYLGVDAIGGAAVEFPMKSIFSKGGSLLYGSTWSSETGSELSQRAVFVSTEGQAAVYVGTDPTSSTTWRLANVYEITRPLGKNSFANIGGELICITESGLVPLSEAIVKDVAALEISAITREVSPKWGKIVKQFGSRDFGFVKWPKKGLGYIFFSTPYGSVTGVDRPNVPPFNYTSYLTTGAWSIYTQWDMQCAIEFEGQVYFGSANGNIYRAEETGKDDIEPYTFKYAEWPTSIGNSENTSTFLEMRTKFTYSVAFLAQTGMMIDDELVWPANNVFILDDVLSIRWDSGFTWDSGLAWDLISTVKTQNQWTSVGLTGYRAAPFVQMSFNNFIEPDCMIVSHTVTYSQGGIVV